MSEIDQELFLSAVTTIENYSSFFCQYVERTIETKNWIRSSPMGLHSIERLFRTQFSKNFFVAKYIDEK